MDEKRSQRSNGAEYGAAYRMNASVVLGTVVFFLFPGVRSFGLSFAEGSAYTHFDLV